MGLRLHPLTLVFLVAITAGCGGAAKAPVEFGVGLPVATATPTVRGFEHAMIERVNRDRAKNQLPPLKFDSKLADIARSHSTDMRDNHFFSHDSPRFGLLEARLYRAGYVIRSARENLAEAPTVDESEEGLLKSPHHYENLMAKDITHIGIGIVQGGVQDPKNLTVTQIFSTPGKLESDTVALQALSSAINQARQRAGLGVLSRHPKLDQIAKAQLATLPTEPSSSDLKTVGVQVTTELAKTPISGVMGVSVGAQNIVDSSQYTVDSSLLSTHARSYGVAVDHSPGAKIPRLRVLVIVGMR